MRRTAAIRRSPLLLIALLATLPPASARAQDWVLEVAAGGAQHDAVASSVGTSNAMLGVRYDGARWLYLTAAAPLDAQGLPWAAGGVGGRLQRPTGGFSLGLDLAAHGYAYREPTQETSGGGLSLEALPFVALAHGDRRLEVRSGVLHHGSTFAGAGASRTVHDNGVRLSAGTTVRAGAEARYLRAEEGGYSYLGASATLPLQRGYLWAQGGGWLSELIDTPVWGVGGSLEVGRSVRLSGWLEQETNDPLYWNAPRRSWGIGVSRAFGGSRTLAPPLTVSPPEAGRVVLRLPADEADQAPSVGGDFNDWTPVAMTRSGDFWVASLPIAPGVYHYAFRRPDGSWFVPESVPGRVDDGFGGYSAVLVVSAAPAGR